MLPDYLLIAVAYAVAILIIRCCTANKITLGVAAGAIAMTAFMIGDPQYRMAGPIVISLAWYFCHKSIRSPNASHSVMPLERLTHKSSGELDAVLSAIIIV